MTRTAENSAVKVVEMILAVWQWFGFKNIFNLTKTLYNKPKPHGGSVIYIIYYCNKSVGAQSIMNTPPCMVWRCVQGAIWQTFYFWIEKDLKKHDAIFVSHNVLDVLS